MIIPEYDIETIRFWVPDDCKRWESIMDSNAIRISAAVIFIAEHYHVMGLAAVKIQNIHSP